MGEERPKVTRGQTAQLLGGCVEELGLYYKSNGKPQTVLKQRNVTIYCVLKRSLQLRSGEGLNKTLLGDQMGGWGWDWRQQMGWVGPGWYHGRQWKQTKRVDSRENEMPGSAVRRRKRWGGKLSRKSKFLVFNELGAREKKQV